jgi:uncharacterized membrane protein HdeD (DUF308 family)
MVSRSRTTERLRINARVATEDDDEPTVAKRRWRGWAIASLALALSTIPVAIVAVKTDPGEPGAGALALTLTVVAALVFTAVVAVRVDWKRYRGDWLVVAAGVIVLAWLVLMVGTYQPAD